jgi:hypothetical protein
MTHFDQLEEKTQKLCEARKNTNGNLSEDLTITCEGELFFLTNVFKDGSFLGFWTHSPWGTCHDQEQGWAVFSKEIKMISSFETKTGGQSTSDGFGGFREWRKIETEIHGKSKKLKPEWDNENFWKISGC